MVCDFKRGNYNQGANQVGVEYMGDVYGRILKEDGTEIGSHTSSSYGWLRLDLKRKLEDESRYEIIDLIEQEVPERFKLKPKE